MMVSYPTVGAATFGQDVDDDAVMLGSRRDPELFAVLVRRYSTVIARYLHRRVGSPLAEDLTSETFLHAFRGRGTYVPGRGTALPWLYGIATNVLNGHRRSEERRLAAIAQATVRVEVRSEPEDEIDDALISAVLLQRLTECLRTLSEDSRDVVALIAFEGLGYQEAAVALGIPIGTVRSRLNRARRELRRCLNQETAGIGQPTHLYRTRPPLYRRSQP